MARDRRGFILMADFKRIVMEALMNQLPVLFLFLFARYVLGIQSPFKDKVADAHPGLPPSHPSTAIAWAVSQGGYLNPSIRYMDSTNGKVTPGMFATADIPAGMVLATIPRSASFASKAGEDLDDFVDRFYAASNDRSSFYHPYFGTLPTTCQNYACLEPDLDTFTVLGARFAKIEARRPVEKSVVMSRRFHTSLVPVMDLFNHKDMPESSRQSVEFDVESHEYQFVSAYSHKAGDEVFNFYLDTNAYKMKRLYNFVEEGKPLNCNDMRTLRRGDSVQRVACIANAPNVTTALMVEEMAEALKVGDMAMVKGAAQWIDKNTNFVLDYTIED
jgi:hypothetical protein